MSRNIIIAGFGTIGWSVASYLVKHNFDLIIIDQDKAVFDCYNDKLDAQFIIGDICNPKVIEKIDFKDSIFLALTDSDETNILACQLISQIYGSKNTIARINKKTFFLKHNWQQLYNKENSIGIKLFSCHMSIANFFNQSLSLPGTLRAVNFFNDNAMIFSTICNKENSFTEISANHSEMLSEVPFKIIMIKRDQETIIPIIDHKNIESIQLNDEVFIYTTKTHASKVMSYFHDSKSKHNNIILLGGGKTGKFLAKKILAQHNNINLTIIEKDLEQAKKIAKSVQQATVLQGDALHQEILQDANLESANALIAATDNDNTNALSSLLAKKFNIPYVYALINNKYYHSTLYSLGIDSLINPTQIILADILQKMRQSTIAKVWPFDDCELFELIIDQFSPYLNQKPGEDLLKQGFHTIAIWQNNTSITQDVENTILQQDDRVIMLAQKQSIAKIMDL